MLMQTSLSNQGFKPFGANQSDHSPGKSVYMASEHGGSNDNRLGYNRTRLGGVKSNLRALKNVKPLVKKKEFSPGMTNMMKDRFSSLEPKGQKWGSPKKLPKITNLNR